MNTADAPHDRKVGVIVVRGGDCMQAVTGAAVARARSLIEKVSSETGIPVLVKEISTAQAIQGALPASIVAQGWEIFGRMNWKMIPGVIMNGKIVSSGEANEAVIKKALLDASSLNPAER